MITDADILAKLHEQHGLSINFGCTGYVVEDAYIEIREEQGSTTLFCDAPRSKRGQMNNRISEERVDRVLSAWGTYRTILRFGVQEMIRREKHKRHKTDWKALATKWRLDIPAETAESEEN